MAGGRTPALNAARTALTWAVVSGAAAAAAFRTRGELAGSPQTPPLLLIFSFIHALSRRPKSRSLRWLSELAKFPLRTGLLLRRSGTGDVGRWCGYKVFGRSHEGELKKQTNWPNHAAFKSFCTFGHGSGSNVSNGFLSLSLIRSSRAFRTDGRAHTR